MKKPLRAAVFLDRDGTLNVEVEYLHRIEEFEWIRGAPEAIVRLNHAGLLVIVVTNQAGVARGYYTEDEIEALHRFMQESLAEVGARIDAFYYCAYHPQGRVSEYRRNDPCRKPGTGMFERAIREWDLDPSKCFAVGDKNTDIIPGVQLGMTTFLVETGYGVQEEVDTPADFVVKDVGAAVNLILELALAASP